MWSCRTEGGINHDHSIEMLPDAQHRVWSKTKKEAMQRMGTAPASAWRVKRLLFSRLLSYYNKRVESDIWEGVRAYSAWMVSTMDRRRMRQDGPGPPGRGQRHQQHDQYQRRPGDVQGVPQLAVTVCS